jgi:hypothetical protein
LASNVKSIMTKLAESPRHIQSYFMHPRIRYAA